MVTSTLQKQSHILSNPDRQLDILSETKQMGIPDFREKLSQHDLGRLTAIEPEILQVNLGKMCNQTCRHCHVDAGPDRKEIMESGTMKQILELLPDSPIKTVDLTGGAPELNPNFTWFVEELNKFNKHIMVRCNLTIIESNKKFNSLPEFYKENQIEVIASLPYYSATRTDSQRGNGVFNKSITALQRLNEAGYGQHSGDLQLNLVYNPSGAFLPGHQESLEVEFKKRLMDDFGISFNRLYTITNLPISRFLDYLISSGKLEDYLIKLVNAFNPVATQNLMCKNTLSVGWDGSLYDCDFNQMLNLKIDHISNLKWNNLPGREIITGQHCFGCTAGAGSSCGGAIT